MFRSPPQQMWDFTIHPFQGPASSLALMSTKQRNSKHLFMSIRPFEQGNSQSMYYIVACYGLSPPLADIVLFELSLSGFPSRLYNTSARERFPHPYKGCFVLHPNRCRISQSTPLQGSTSSLAFMSQSMYYIATSL